MEVASNASDRLAPLTVEESEQTITIRGDGFRFGFDKASATLNSWQIGGTEQLAEPVTDNFYRAMTDNDLAPFEVLVPDVYGKDWLEAGINTLTGEGLAIKVWQRSAGEVEVETSRIYDAGKLSSRHIYAINGNGDCAVQCRGRCPC